MQNIKITKENYREWDAINYSLISKFMECPDVALMPNNDKLVFRFGRLFEELVECEKTFFKNYEIFYLPEIPTTWLEIVNSNDPKSFVEYNKNGSLKKSEKNTKIFEWVCALGECTGKLPVSDTEMAALFHMKRNLMACQYRGIELGTLLKDAEWQVPHVWTKKGIEKKCLFDAVTPPIYDPLLGSEYRMVIDTKTTGSIQTFKSFLRNKYWIQDLHYMEGALDKYGKIYSSMVFAVVTTSPPYMAQCFTVDPINHDTLQDKLDTTIEALDKWIDKGTPPQGWQEEEQIKVWG